MFRLVLLLTIGVALCNSLPTQDRRIIGGRAAYPGELPYIASLRYWGTTFHFGGAVLLNSRYVVTSAYNLRGRAGNSINIVLGTNYLDSGIVNRPSDLIVIHDQFAIDGNTISNDIAVVRSLYVIVFTTTISPIPMSSMFIRDNLTAQAAGWGATDRDKGPDSNSLRIADVFTAPCKNTEFKSFTPQHICAGAQSATAPPVGVCTTDIGGPLVFYGQLIGISVHHNYNGCGLLLDGYARISSYIVWINSKIN